MVETAQSSASLGKMFSQKFRGNDKTKYKGTHKQITYNIPEKGIEKDCSHG